MSVSGPDGHADGPAPDQQEMLLAAALHRLQESEPDALAALLREHPQHSDAIRRRMRLLHGIGMLNAGEHQTDPIPERLGEFVLRERLGAGGMGVVYLAEQPSLRRLVALKLIRPEHLYFPLARERFRREVEAVASLQHPSIVRVYSANVEGELPYFTMERIEGVSLDRLLAALRPRAPSQLTEAEVHAALLTFGGAAGISDGAPPCGWVELCCRWTCDLAEAIAYAHERGILHRDLKPSNVMITWSLRAMLLDFGLASARDQDQITRSGVQLGSLPYMAPEQVRGDSKRIGPQTDVYGLGVLLYELLTLVNPFCEGSNDEDTRQRIVSAVPPLVRTKNAAVSWDAETVCHCAMAPEPERRYISAAAFAQDLRNLLSLRPITVRRPGAVQRLRRWIRRHPTRTAAGAMGMLLVLVTPMAFAVSEHRLRQQIERDAARRDQILKFFTDELLAAVSPEEVGKDASMRQVLDAAASQLDGRFAEQPLVEAAIRSTVGHTYRSLGALDTAEVHLLRSLDLLQRHAGRDARETLEVERRICMVWSAQGRYREQADRLRDVLARSRAAFGADDADTLKTANNLGLGLSRLSDHDAAIATLHDVLVRRLRLLGEADESAQTSMSNLGVAYFQAGRFDEAEPWIRRELALCRRRHPDDHPSVLTSRQNLANLLASVDREAEGLAQMQMVVAARARVLGRQHTETLISMANEARMLANLGRHADALAVLNDIRRHGNELAADGTLLLRVRTAQVEALRGVGRIAEARTLIDALVRDSVAKHGDCAKPTIDARFAAATVLIDTGQRAAAAEQLAAAIAGWQTTPTRRLTHLRLEHAKNLRALQRREDGERELLLAHEFLRERAPSDPTLGAVLEELSALHEEWGHAATAATWRERRTAWQQQRAAASGRSPKD